jgi:HEAT repeat protein
MRSLLLLPLLLSLPGLAERLVAQRPKSAAEALTKFRAVADRPESERQRAAGDLGDFADAEVTTVLLAELARAESLGYRQSVVRALGEHQRPGAVAALVPLLVADGPVRLWESVATALANQGDDGVKALATLLAQQPAGGGRRHAICDGLGRNRSELARDALLTELGRATGRDRLPSLRALRSRAGEAPVDAVRLQLAKDGDALVAATALQQLAEHAHADAPALGLELSRRNPGDAKGDVATAVCHALLLQPTPPHHEALLVAAALAEDPFGKAKAPLWSKAVGDAALVRWFADQAPLRKSSAERCLVAEVLGMSTGELQPIAAAGLGKLLLHKEPDVVRTAALALARLGPQHALAPLQKLLGGKEDWQVSAALVALHSLRKDEPEWRTELLTQCDSKQAPARAAALHLLARLPAGDNAPLVAAAAANLTHKQWPVRSAAIDLLRNLRTAASVPPLFERLDAEQGRLRQDLVEALEDLTRLQFPTTAAWQAWWQKERTSFRIADRRAADADADREAKIKGPKATVSYWNLPVHSDRVTFVVDVSGSMAQPFGTGGGTRLDEAKRQLVRVLGLLGSKAKGNVVTFAEGARGFAETLQPLDDRRQKAITAFAEAMASKGPTNVHDGLQRAFADAEVDTIFLLTDGQPSSGPVVDEEALLALVARWNTGRGVRIHTVALGGKSRFLERLAQQSGGNHTVAR